MTIQCQLFVYFLLGSPHRQPQLAEGQHQGFQSGAHIFICVFVQLHPMSIFQKSSLVLSHRTIQVYTTSLITVKLFHTCNHTLYTCTSTGSSDNFQRTGDSSSSASASASARSNGLIQPGTVCSFNTHSFSYASTWRFILLHKCICIS